MSEVPLTSGRRSATGRRRSFSPTLALGALLVAATGGSLLLVQPQEAAERGAPPTAAPLDSSALGCPSALPGADDVALATGAEAGSGEVAVRTGRTGSARTARLTPGAVTTVRAEGPVAIAAAGELAPALLGARFGDRQLASVECPSPTPETWFTGVGAGARHDGVLELVNPDNGPAVADVWVLGRGGPVDVPELRGLTVRGRDSVRLELAEVAPRRSELALRVVVSRGRLATTLLDRVPALGSRPLTEDWIAPQPEPVSEAVHLGLPTGPGTDVLTLANPGEDEARVEVRVLTPDSAFVPEGVEEVRVPPGSVRTVTLTTALRAAVRDKAVGVAVVSTVPVTSSLRTQVADDLSLAAPVVPVSEATTALLPPSGAAQLLLADADAVGTAAVAVWAADGSKLPGEKVELRPGQGAVIELPRGAALVRVTPERASVHAAVLVSGPGGATAVALGARPTASLIPDVRPGLP